MKWLAKRITNQKFEIIKGQKPNAILFDKCLEITDSQIEHPDDCKIETGVDEFNQEFEYVVFDAEAKQARLDKIEADRIAYETNYATLRQKEYPSIQEQLDMLWHDKQNNTSNWEKLISEIKQKYPKV